MKFDLSGKNAVVTGGSSGIGKAITETLKEQGAEVFVIDLNENPSNKKEPSKCTNILFWTFTWFYSFAEICNEHVP